MGKLDIGTEKTVQVRLTKAQVNQLDYIRNQYGMSYSDAVRMLIKQEAVRMYRKEMKG